MVVLGIGGGPRGPFTSYQPSDLPLGTGHLYSKTVVVSALPCTFHGMATNLQQDAGHCANASTSALHEDIFWNVTRGLNTSAQVSVLTGSTYGSMQRPPLKLLVSLPLEAMKSLNNTQLTSDGTFTRIFTSPPLPSGTCPLPAQHEGRTLGCTKAVRTQVGLGLGAKIRKRGFGSRRL